MQYMHTIITLSGCSPLTFHVMLHIEFTLSEINLDNERKKYDNSKADTDENCHQSKNTNGVAHMNGEI